MTSNRLLSLKLLFFILALFTQAVFFHATGINPPQDPLSSGLRLSTFDIDATPPVGSYLAYNKEINKWDLGLRAKGVILLGSAQPIVLCSIDWIGIANESHDAFRKSLADAAGTIPERVAVHTVHQHDAPVCDFGAEKILKEAGLDPLSFESSFALDVIHRLGIAVEQSLKQSQPVTHIGLGQAPVYKVASNRRIMGTDGKVRAVRYSSCRDSALRAEPEGLIDPIVSLISFWNNDRPLAILSYYAVHPQSYYQTGIANPDFPGIARFMRQLAVPQALHIHFNGASGNITAGKYNDGSHENRFILAERLADGMKRAWENSQRESITADAVRWSIEPVALPPAKDLDKVKSLLKTETMVYLSNNMMKLPFLQRCQTGTKIDITCLSLGRVRILHLPGELCIEYQLAAKAERPDLFIAMAAYGDYAPGYICTTIAYEEGGYEAGDASNVAPEVETIIMSAIHKLLKAQP